MHNNNYNHYGSSASTSTNSSPSNVTVKYHDKYQSIKHRDYGCSKYVSSSTDVRQTNHKQREAAVAAAYGFVSIPFSPGPIAKRMIDNARLEHNIRERYGIGGTNSGGGSGS